jgi:DivIVA domain-containing protein
LELDRNQIERNDFSAARRGYDPDEVDRHLREIADSVADLKRQQKPSPASLATAAADQVRSIVEAAENSAAEIQESAETEARRIRDEASTAARETRERADSDAAKRVADADESTQRALERAASIESEIDRLLGDIRSAATGLIDRVTTGAGALQTELDQARNEFASVRESRLESGGGGAPLRDDAGPVDAEPEVVAEAEDVQAEVIASDGASIRDDDDDDSEIIASDGASISEADRGDTAVEDEVALDDEDDEEPEPEPEPASTGGGGGGRSIRGAEGARLIALNMALNGTPRDETARYLSQNFELDDQDALLDEVYARVGG